MKAGIAPNGLMSAASVMKIFANSIRFAPAGRGPPAVIPRRADYDAGATVGKSTWAQKPWRLDRIKDSFNMF
ncbi:MAG TPA: hypothetical protein PLX53_02560, partial [Tenuifilaceae bacterium]|nr:hypothetical protein [Tenuifilaceae bacterium]